MNRRKFLSTCACCGFASAGAVFLNAKMYSDDLHNINRKTTRIGIHITEHCNLGCKYCSHFSCIAQKEFYDLDKFRQDTKRLSDIYNNKLPHLRLLGGEPLLNPQINEYVKSARQNFPKTIIQISTNSILLDDMDEEFWKTLNENDVSIVPTVYPIKINWESIIKKAEKYNVTLYNDSPKTEKLTIENLYNYTKNYFYKTTLRHDMVSHIDRSTCTVRKGHFDMYDGKLYPCFNIAYVRHLNKKFGTDFKVSEKDYLDLYKINDLNDVRKFSNTHLFPFCSNCSLRFELVKWEVSKEHSLSEWT